MRKEHRLGVFEDRVQREVFGCREMKQQKVEKTAQWGSTSYWRGATKKDEIGACDMQGREMSAGCSGKPEGKNLVVSPGRKSRINVTLYYAMKARKGNRCAKMGV